MKPLFGWPGGKRCLVKSLCARIPEHALYVEVFCGSAKLLFAKEPSRAEVINDINGDVANFFRVVKHRPAELAEALEHDVIHPERFRQLKNSEPEDELDRALRFAFLTWYSFGSKGQHFARPALQDSLAAQAKRPLDTIRELLEKAGERLNRVRIEQQDFEHILERFDSRETFFYLDPPYIDFGSIGRYTAMPEERAAALFSTLASRQAAWLMSFDNHPTVTRLAAEYKLATETVETTYSMAGRHRSANGGAVTEILISKPAASAETLPIAA